MQDSFDFGGSRLAYRGDCPAAARQGICHDLLTVLSELARRPGPQFARMRPSPQCVSFALRAVSNGSWQMAPGAGERREMFGQKSFINEHFTVDMLLHV